MYIPKEYQENPKNNIFYDYALIRLSESYKSEGKQEFLPLSYNYRKDLSSNKLAIFGYPDQNYENIGKTDVIDTTFQSGFGAKDRFVEIAKHQQIILNTVST